MGNVNGEPHADSVDRPGRPQEKGAIDVVTSQQAARPRRRRLGQLEAGQNLIPSDQP